MLNQQPHDKGRGQGKTTLVEKSYRQETKNQRMSSAPEPEVLMQNIEGYNDNDQ